MDFNYIEELVLKSKAGDELSKEKLILEFTPFILNLSATTFIYGYDFQDIQNECYLGLFKCLSMYNIETHRFVAYAVNGIKNNINDLIKRNIKRSPSDGANAFSLYENLKDTLPSLENTIEENICTAEEHKILKQLLNSLSDPEREMINYIFFKENTTKNYAKLKNMCYSTTLVKRNKILTKLSKDLIKLQL